MSERETMFSCPNCGDPCATTVERNLDIHSGATYRCAQCGKRVVFEAMTTSGYVEYANLAAQLAALEAERDRLREALKPLAALKPTLSLVAAPEDFILWCRGTSDPDDPKLTAAHVLAARALLTKETP
jgi:predicted RNA-binding Zn-ribbon protein involved in translation (DUF1610 family)